MTPGRTVEGILLAIAALGMDSSAICDEVGIPRPIDPERGYATAAVTGILRAATRRRPAAELPTEIGLAAPFGCFGVVDYLAGSAATLAGGLRALAGHFAGITRDQRLLLDEGPPLVLEARDDPGGDAMGEELSIAVTLGRFRQLAGPGFTAEAVTLRRPDPGESRHAELLGCPVEFGASATTLSISAVAAELPLASRDPRLASVLLEVARRLDLASEGEADVEVAVRSRLRDLLPWGDVSAVAVARTMGLSERTLHRRLSSVGRTFQEVLDVFRARESERLLRTATPLVEIALALGCADQTAWTRAFRRWKATTPTAFRLAAAAKAAPRGG